MSLHERYLPGPEEMADNLLIHFITTLCSVVTAMPNVSTMTASEFSRDPVLATNGVYTDIWYNFTNSASGRSTINDLLEAAKHGIDVCVIGTTALHQQRIIRKAC